MKSTVGKGLLFYLFVLLSIVFGVFCIFVGILIFSPGTEIFGISYSFSKDEVYYQKTTNNNESVFIDDLIKQNKLTKLVIETDNFDVYVNRENVNHLNLRVKNIYSGLTKHESRKKAVITNNYDSDTKTYTIKVLGPECLFWFSNGSKITVALPDSFNASNIDLEIKTNTSDVCLGNTDTYQYTFHSLLVTSNSPSLILINPKIQFVDSVKIVAEKGTIKQNGTLNLNNFEIQTNNAKIFLKTINADNVKIISESSGIKIGQIKGNMLYDSKSGVISIEKIEGEFSCTERINISNIQIGEAHGYVLLPKANTSNITIDKLYARARIITNSGNINIKQAFSIVYTETNTGKINVTFTPDDSVSEFTGDMSNLKTVSGDIIANYDGLKLNNVITTEKGNIVVNYNNNLEFNLSYNCQEKDPILAEGIPNRDTLGKQATDVKIGNGSSVNKLNITNTNGILEIRNTFTIEE